MLDPKDIYTSSGSNTLYGCWTSNVTLHDASSFYNYEEDNLPILDLQERTHLLWEKLGHPTSAVTGFSLVVSADAVTSCNSNVFTTLSACLEKLPEVINAPVLIEVASFGDLGEMKISGKKFGPRGSIEIINRNFAAQEGATSGVNLNRHIRYSGDVNGLASAITFGDATLASSHNSYSSIPSVIHGLVYSRVESLSSYVFSSVGLAVAPDARLTNNLTVFTKQQLPTITTKLTAALAPDNTTTPWVNGSSGTLSFLPYEYGASISADTPEVYDVSTINEMTSTEVIHDLASDTDSLSYATTYAYGNRLQKIVVENCNGPIYIRNFSVDGNKERKVGIEIVNSNNVYLERCAASRFTEAGLRSVNSNLNLLRGFIAYRNYGFNSAGDRIATAYSVRVGMGYNGAKDAAGIELINSRLNLYQTLQRDEEVYGNAWASWETPVKTLIKTPVPATGWMFCLSRNSDGLRAYNSFITGGQKETTSTSQANKGFHNATNFYCEFNTNAGIDLNNSELELDGRIIVQGNYRGILATGSNIRYDTLIAKFNQKQGFYGIDSNIVYNKNLQLPNDGEEGVVDTAASRVHHNSFWMNGNHIQLQHSQYIPVDTSAMPSVYERFVCASSFGVFLGRKVPSILVDDNSRLRLVNLGIEALSSLEYAEQASKLISVLGNSELQLHGTKNYITKIIGPAGVANQKGKVALYARDKSTIKISGPTVIGRFAIDGLAENHSTISIEPHKTLVGELDLVGMTLTDPGNHTAVELHSTRACLVADKESSIVMKDVGDYLSRWTGTYGTAIQASTLDYNTESAALNTQLYTSGGSIQFYPNANDTALYPPAIDTPSMSLYSNNTMTSSIHIPGLQYWFTQGQHIGDPANAYQLSGITTGGMCVRAINNSIVDVLNVHFPTGWWNPSSVIYDFSGTDSGGPLCSRLFIWNIADSSLLTAKYISVSGNHPADVGSYYGPSGDWGASNAPATTPDSGTLSILDYYGKSVLNAYGKSTFENLGPFRLYFSYDPAANWLTPSSGGNAGYIPQVFAQGYNFSAVCVLPSGVSSTYTSLTSSGSVSAFHYGEDIVSDGVMVVVDDSAANAFANAKHCSVGKSGMRKIVEILYPIEDSYGGDSATAASKTVGKGFKSSNSFDLERDN